MNRGSVTRRIRARQATNLERKSLLISKQRLPDRTLVPTNMIDTSDNPETRDEHFVIPKRVVLLSGVERRPAVVCVDEGVWEGSNLKGAGTSVK